MSWNLVIISVKIIKLIKLHLFTVLKTSYIWKDLNEVHKFMSLFKQIHNTVISMDYFTKLIDDEHVCKVDSYKYTVVKIFSNNKYAIYQII